MPYTESAGLPFERASKLGHLTVVSDPFVREMLDEFERTTSTGMTPPDLDGDRTLPAETTPLEFVVSVDGSITEIPNTLATHKMLSYVKVGALALSLRRLADLQGAIVDPDLVQQVLRDGADTFSTVLPLSNVSMPGLSLFDSIRRSLEATFRHFMDGGVYDTLRFLVSREWLPTYTMTAHFACPACDDELPVPRSVESFDCPHCASPLTLVDYLGITSGLSEDGNDGRAAVDLMVVLENLLLIHYLRLLLQKGFSGRTLLLKDGPLMLAHQYSRIVDPINEYLAHLWAQGERFYIAGIEKQGAFANHVPDIERVLAVGEVFVPSNRYILSRIKSGSNPATQYGERVLYGAKAFYRLDERNCLVLNVPYGLYRMDVKTSELYGLDQIVSTLRHLGSRQFQNALLPIAAVNRIVSLSVYPSNKILEKLADASIRAAAPSP